MLTDIVLRVVAAILAIVEVFSSMFFGALKNPEPLDFAFLVPVVGLALGALMPRQWRSTSRLRIVLAAIFALGIATYVVVLASGFRSDVGFGTVAVAYQLVAIAVLAVMLRRTLRAK